MENTNALEQVAKAEEKARIAAKNGRFALVEMYRRLLREWLDALETGDTSNVGNDMLDTLTGGMSGDLALRDAIIVSTVCARDGKDEDVPMDALVDMILYPHSKITLNWVQGKLSGAFNSEERVMGKRRTNAARLIISRAVIRLLEEDNDTKYAAQPLAVLAYIEWFAGYLARAFALAQAALEKDGDTSLAVIVVKGIMGDMNPRCVEKEMAEHKD